MCYGTRAVTVVETSYAVICIETRINPITRVMFKRIKYNDFYSIVVKKTNYLLIYTKGRAFFAAHERFCVLQAYFTTLVVLVSSLCIEIDNFPWNNLSSRFQLTLKRSHKSREIWIKTHEPFPSGDSLRKLYIRINFNFNLSN